MKTALVIGGTHKDIDAMGTFALIIKDKCPQLATELVILHDYRKEVPANVKQAFNSIMPTRFIKYKCPVSVFKLYQNKNMRYFSPMVFGKIECFSLLKEYDAVIWSDYDVLIRDDISELLDFKGSFLFSEKDDSPLIEMFYPSFKKLLDSKHARSFKEGLKEYDFEVVGLSTPLFILKDIPHDKIDEYVDFLYANARKYMRHLYLPEQCVFSMMQQHYGIKYEVIDKDIYVCHPKDATEKTKILHAYGQPKFWNGLENAEWNAYLASWKEIKNKC